MKILIVGAGGVGGYIGARLIKNSDSLVSFVARGKHLEAIKDNGLKVIEDDKEYIILEEEREKEIAEVIANEKSKPLSLEEENELLKKEILMLKKALEKCNRRTTLV